MLSSTINDTLETASLRGGAKVVLPPTDVVLPSTYTITISTANEQTLFIDLEQSDTGIKWSNSFSSETIATYTAKAGCPKPFGTFVQMLVSAASQSSREALKAATVDGGANVTLDLLTPSDITNLRKKKQPPRAPFGEDHSTSLTASISQSQSTNSKLSNSRRYLLLNYIAPFERVQFPLHLKLVENGSPESLATSLQLRRLQLENDSLKSKTKQLEGAEEIALKLKEELDKVTTEKQSTETAFEKLLQESEKELRRLKTLCDSLQQTVDKQNSEIDQWRAHAQQASQSGDAELFEQRIRELEEQLQDLHARHKRAANSRKREFTELADELERMRAERDEWKHKYAIERVAASLSTSTSSASAASKPAKREGRSRERRPPPPAASTNRNSGSFRRFDPTAYVQEQQRKMRERSASRERGSENSRARSRSRSTSRTRPATKAMSTPAAIARLAQPKTTTSAKTKTAVTGSGGNGRVRTAETNQSAPREVRISNSRGKQFVVRPPATLATIASTTTTDDEAEPLFLRQKGEEKGAKRRNKTQEREEDSAVSDAVGGGQKKALKQRKKRQSRLLADYAEDTSEEERVESEGVVDEEGESRSSSATMAKVKKVDSTAGIRAIRERLASVLNGAAKAAEGQDKENEVPQRAGKIVSTETQDSFESEEKKISSKLARLKSFLREKTAMQASAVATQE